MPSRPVLHSSDPLTSSSVAAPSSTTTASLPAGRSIPRVVPQDVPSLPPMTSNPAASPPYRRGHTRSISHPFTSPFTGIGNRRKKSISKQDFLDSDDDDDDDGFYLPNPLSSSPRKGPPRLTLGEDLTTGKCMTCNCSVRWPRNLKVFRCTECLTVNDLEPCQESKDLGAQGSPEKNGKPTPPTVPRKAIPMSVERTSALVEGCLATYLRQRLEAPEQPPVPPKADLFDSHSSTGHDENSSQLTSHSSSHLSEPQQARDPHIRSASTSDRSDGTKDSHNLKPGSIPTPLRKEGRGSQMKSRDAQNTPKGVQVGGHGRPDDHGTKERGKHVHIFRALEEYIISSFKGCETLNVSFTTAQPVSRTPPDNRPPKQDVEASPGSVQGNPIIEPDAKTLLLGDLAENSSWWMVDAEESSGLSHTHPRQKSSNSSRAVTSRSPRINWSELAQWYRLIMTAGTSWVETWSTMKPSSVSGKDEYMKSKTWDHADLSVIEREVSESRLHLHRTLLKATENLLKRPRRPLKKPDDIRFLLMLLANPLIYPSSPSLAVLTVARGDGRPSPPKESNYRLGTSSNVPPPPPPKHRTGGPGHHSGIVKRILGLLANLPNDCHHYLVSWLSRFSVGQFEKMVDLVGGFVTYRLTRQHGRKRSESAKDDNSLIPTFTSAARNTPAELHAALNGRNHSKQPNEKGKKPVVYSDDWQIRAAGRVMALLFTANNSNVARKPDGVLGQESTSAPRPQGSQRGHMVPISSFYNTLLDYSDLVADFEAWEVRSAKFSFCQYPFFLSIWAKIHIMEYDARRQMEVKAREAFFNSILNRKAVSQYLMLKVRRDCLVEDSLRGVSEVVGSNQEEIKKGLRIEFVGEEGVDAGGLRKEWFLLLVREIFDPHHGLFIYDEDSQYCYFNPFCFESSEQFFLVGVLLGLAIYNSTILDVALPPFAFKKLLAAAPQTSGPQPSTTRPTYKCSLDDLAEYRPVLAKGLRSLLEFEGDVADTFCYDFVAHVDRYGEVVPVPLCPGGENKPVTNANRREFVDLYVQYQLDTAVTRQFEPFRRGFFTVCGGNALSLFRPEEIELLVRGSDEALDVSSLRAVATYDNWPGAKAEAEPVVGWFWDFFEHARPQAQRKILSFITGSDRIPAMGATSLMVRLVCLGEDSSRFPTARTCFNQLGMYQYATRQKLERMLWEAVLNSEGFGLK